MRSQPRRTALNQCLFALILAAFGLGTPLSPLLSSAQAQMFGYDSERPKKRVAKRPTRPTQAALQTGVEDPTKKKNESADKDGAKSRKGPLFAVISLGDQHVTIYNHDGVVTRSRVSTGMAGHRTPTGVFSIIGRSRYHYSNIYGGAPMPFMQRITWSGVAMHLGVVPGYPASHGCIRLPSNFAPVLWGMTKVGERVVISPRDVTPEPFSHTALPAPRMHPAPGPIAETTPLATPVSARTTELTQVAEITTSGSSDSSPGPALLNPIQFASTLKSQATAASAAAEKAAKQTFDIAEKKTAEARAAVAALKSAEAAKTAAEAKLAAAAKATDAAAPEAKAAAEAQLTDAANALDIAKAAEAVATRDSFTAVARWKEANAAVGPARAALKDAGLRSSPISVLVSKKDKRVYIRQGLTPVYEGPASVRDPEIPLGTHLYIASSVAPGGSSLEWTSISMPASSGGGENIRTKKRAARDAAEDDAPPAPRLAQSNAAEALARVEIPDEVRDMISERLWTGGSLIVSDNSLSPETSDIGTDLVVNVR